MGFDQDATRHHFRITPKGGSIEVTVRDAADSLTLAAVRSHLRAIAGQFAAGEFDKPLQAHDEVLPGVEGMRKRKDRISYRYERSARKQVLPACVPLRLCFSRISARDDSEPSRKFRDGAAGMLRRR